MPSVLKREAKDPIIKKNKDLLLIQSVVIRNIQDKHDKQEKCKEELNNIKVVLL